MNIRLDNPYLHRTDCNHLTTKSFAFSTAYDPIEAFQTAFDMNDVAAKYGVMLSDLSIVNFRLQCIAATEYLAIFEIYVVPTIIADK